MNFHKVATLSLLLLGSRLTFADASYQETTQITGGSLADSLKSVSFFSKSMRNMFAPITTTTMVHGNQKAVVGKDSVEITDLDKETITHIDNLSKTYSVTTFAQMRQAFANASKQMEQSKTEIKQEQAKEQAQAAQQPKSDLQTTYDVSAKNTGVTKDVNGLTAQEQLITMQMRIVDPKAPPTEAVNSVTYVVTTDAWIAPDPPEVKEIQEFDLRFGKQLMAGVDLSAFKAEMAGLVQRKPDPGMSQMFSSQPGSAEAMANMQKEMAKLKGTRVMEVTRMGGSGTGPGASQAMAPATPPPSGNDVAGSIASETAAQTAAAEASRMGVLGSALGSSALGAFHRKKAATPPPPAATADASTATPAAGQTTSGATLMEMTTQKMNFSQGGVPSAAFEIPAGFRKVETPTYGASKN